MMRWGGVMRPNPTNYSMNLPRWTRIWAGDYNSEWVQRWSLCALRVHIYQCTWLQWAMQTPLAWPRYAHSTDQNTSTSNQSTKLKRQTGSTNASSNTSYRQETSKDSAVDRVGRRGSLSSSSEDRAQRISGSQWARPERLSARRSEGGPLLPVTSSDCCLQLTTQCWKLCC